MFTGVCAGLLALSSAFAVSAADYVEFNYEPLYEVDFDEFIYEEGMEFPIEDATTHFKYSDLEILANVAENGGRVEIVDAGGKHGFAANVDMSEAIPGESFAVQSATDLVHTFNSGKITVKYDMLIPAELDAEAGETVFVQIYTGKTDEIGRCGNNGNITYPVNEWFTVTANYYLTADKASGQKEILFTDKSGVTTVIAEKAVMPNNNFFKGLVGGGISKIRFFSQNNQNNSFMIDNISISSLPGVDSESGEYVIEAQSRGTGDFLGGATNKGTTYHAAGIGGKDYTVARYEVAENQDLTTNIQTRRAYGSGVFIDDYVEYNAEYYFPTECNDIQIFQQLFFEEKVQADKNGVAYGASGRNRNINPWEIINGKIDIYSSYADSYQSNPTPIPLNEWFTIKTKIYREKQDDAYAMYYAVDLVMQTSGDVVEIVPKTLFDYNSSQHAASYLANGIFAFRENLSRTSETKDAIGPFYIGNKSLLKAPAYEIGDIAFTDDEDFEIDYIDGIAGINATVSAVDYIRSGKNAMLWCAAYDENDVLIDVKIKAGQLPQGTPDIIKLDDYFEIPGNASYFKAGLVDDNMTPFTVFGYLD